MKKARKGLLIALIVLFASFICLSVWLNSGKSPFLLGSKPICVTEYLSYTSQSMIPEDFVESVNKLKQKTIYGIMGNKLISYNSVSSSYKVIYIYGQSSPCEPYGFTNIYMKHLGKIVTDSKNIYFILNSEKGSTLCKYDLASWKIEQLLQANTHMNSVSINKNDILVAADKMLFVSHNGGKSFLKIDSENCLSLFPKTHYLFESLLQGNLFSYFDKKSGYLCIFDFPTFGNFISISSDFLKSNLKIIDLNSNIYYPSPYGIAGIDVYKDGNSLRFAVLENPAGPSLYDYKFRKPFLDYGFISTKEIYNTSKVSKLKDAHTVVLPKEIHIVNALLQYKDYILFSTDRGIWAFRLSAKIKKFFKAPFVYGNVEKMILWRQHYLVFSESDINSPGLFFVQLKQ